MIQTPLVVRLDDFASATFPSRAQEKAATQRLLSLLYPSAQLIHTSEGAPLLQGEGACAISLSHTRHYLALVEADNSLRVGIDIEELSARPLRLAARFMHSQEQAYLATLLPEQQIPYALAVWCAKEAAYKALSQPQMDFRAYYYLEQYTPHSARLRYIPEERYLPIRFYPNPHYLVAVTYQERHI